MSGSPSHGWLVLLLYRIIKIKFCSILFTAFGALGLFLVLVFTLMTLLSESFCQTGLNHMTTNLK